MRALLIAVFCCASSIASGGVNEWTRIGPNSNDVTAFSVDPSSPDTLYEATTGIPSLWKSTNGGGAWSAIGPSDLSVVQAIVADPRIANHVMVIDSFDFFQTFDGGATWSGGKFPFGIVTGFLYGMQLANDGTITVRASQICFGSLNCSGGGVAMSVDGGAHWSKTGLGDQTVAALTMDPSDSGTAYAQTIDYNKVTFVTTAASLMRTRDGGKNWTRIAQTIDVRTGSHLFIDPAIRTTLDLTTDSGLWTSLDGGDTWTRSRATAPFTNVLGLSADPLDRGSFFAATPGFAAPDCPTPPLPCLLLPCPPGQSCPVLRPSPADLLGIIRTTDHGNSWTRYIDPALPRPDSLHVSNTFLALIIDPRRATFYGVRSDGVFAYTLAPASHRRGVRP